jgi:HemY protein
MMRALFWLLAVFAAAVAIAVAGRFGEGYVLLVYPPWRVETSLLFAVLVLVAGFLLGYAVVRVVGSTLDMPARVREYRQGRRRLQAQGALSTALQCYYEGRYARAEREAALAWEEGASPGIAALIAARAAQQMREHQRRDQWLERAAQAGESLHAARLLTQAELALEERDFTGARNALRELRGAGPRNIAAARMQLRAARGSQDWEEVLRLTALLEKRGALASAIVEENRVQAQIELLARAAGERGQLEARLRRVPAEDLEHPRVAAAAARAAAELGNAALARELIERSLAKEWNGGLAQLYGELPRIEPQRLQEEARSRIERAERWLREHGQDAQLLAALGRLCMAAELWGKAQNYLEASLSFGETRAAHAELARLAEREGRTADAQKHFRRAGELP